VNNNLVKIVAGNGGHYSISEAIEPMNFLKACFPDDQANEMNLCFFSTSGVHGSYRTIEEEEKENLGGITFLVVQPRIVAMTYGVVHPKTPAEFEFLKKLRESSKSAVIDDIG